MKVFFIRFKKLIILLLITISTQSIYSQNNIVVNNVPISADSTVTVTLRYCSNGGYYAINNILDLRALSILVFNDNTSRYSANKITYNKTFKLTQDISFSSYDNVYDFDSNGIYESNFLPIGGWIYDTVINCTFPSNIAVPVYDTTISLKNSGLTFFAGTFDGNGHTISGLAIYNLTNESDTASNFVGLFGFLKGLWYNKAVVRNLGINYAELQGYQYIGGISGYCTHANILNCYVNVSNIKGYKDVGGIIGISSNDVELSYSYVTNSNIEGINEYVGGLCGENYSCKDDTTITESPLSGNHQYAYFYSKINKSYVNNSIVRGSLYVGGICGLNNGTNYNNNICYAQINNCYSNSFVNRNVNSNSVSFGGIIGDNYNNNGVVNNSYYNSSWNSNNIANVTENNTITDNNSTMYVRDTNLMRNNTAFVNELNNGDSCFVIDIAYLFSQNQGYPILPWQRFTIKSNQTLIISPSYSGSLPSNIIMEEGADLINISNHDFYCTTTKSLNINHWTFSGSIFSNMTTDTYRGLIGNNTYLNTYSLPIGLISFNYNNNSWRNDQENDLYWINQSSLMIPKQGYMSYAWDFNNIITNPTTKVTQQGILFNSDTTITITNNGEPTNNGGIWFALSNPYAAKMSIHRFFYLNHTNTPNVQGSVVYTYDPIKNIYNLHKDNDTSYLISAGEGFFIASTHNATTPSFVFSKNQLANNPYSNIPPPTSPFKPIESDPQYMTLTTTTNNYKKEAFFLFNNMVCNGFDDKDAYVLFGSNDSIAEPYFVVDEKKLAINAIKTLPYTCPMNVHSNISDTISFSFTNIPANTFLVLVDNNTETLMNDSSIYTTTITAGENENRFVIKLFNNSSVNDVSEQDDIDIYKEGNVLNVNGDNLQNLYIYNVLSQEVYQKKLSGNSFKENMYLPQGSYVVKVKANNSYKTTKIVF
jgi:hypothetical protein